MKFIPKKKLLQIAKICILSSVIVWVLGKLAEAMFGIQHAPHASESYWERQILEDEGRIIQGVGQNGIPLQLNDTVNVSFSDRIAYNRTIRDFRNPDCLAEVYDAELPSTSIVVVFHNEIYSVLLRLLWGIIGSVRRDNPVYQNANFFDKRTGKTMQLGYKGQTEDSQLLYVKEIILVDDNSTMYELKEKLDYYVKTRLPQGLVKIVRLPAHYGIVRARMEGARNATAEVLVFLDSHCEVHIDWLRPLLQNLKHNTTSVLFPIIDSINDTDFSYNVLDGHRFLIGGFNIKGNFAPIEISKEEIKRRGSDIALTLSPAMPGGLFAMHRSYFWELGAYDEKMSVYGGENLEISFRIWMCGGVIAAVPCSRVGHLDYDLDPMELQKRINYNRWDAARVAKVWMDEYAETFFILHPDLRSDPRVGDVSERVKLREKLKCKSFRWYLQNIYKDKYVPGANSLAFGRFVSPVTGLCMHNTREDKNNSYPLIVYSCLQKWMNAQIMSLTNNGQLRSENLCVYIEPVWSNKTSVCPCRIDNIAMFKPCKPYVKAYENAEPEWRYIPSMRMLQNIKTDLCLESPKRVLSQVFATRCDTARLTQTWYIEYSDESLSYEYTVAPISEDQSQKLAKLTGHRSYMICGNEK